MVSAVVLVCKYRSACVAFLIASFLFFGLYAAAIAQEPHDQIRFNQPQPHAPGIDAALSHVRTSVLETIARHLPHAHAQLLGGILVGARQSFPDSMRESFNRIGITHIVAVSGYNITVLLALLYALCLGFGIKRSHGIGIVIAGIAGFTLLSGASPATVRAALMGGVVVVARYAGRNARSHTAILIALAAMLLGNPFLLFDIGFQLSFSAMIGLIYLAPNLELLSVRFPDVYGLKQILIQTLAAIAATAPLILWYFGTVSIIAPLANILIVPLVPFIMAAGAMSVGISAVFEVFAVPFFSVCAPYLWAFVWAPLEYVIRVSSHLSTIPLASVSIYNPLVLLALVVCSYAMFGMLLFMPTRRQAPCALS